MISFVTSSVDRPETESGSIPPTDASGATQGPGIDRLIRSLSLATFLQWLGASAFLPLLPEYLRQRGGSDAVVGAVMAAFFVAALLFQYPAGLLTDRIGRRPVLLGGLVVYALASFAFIFPVSPIFDIFLRAGQGAGAGAAEVASLAVISGAVSIARRGRAFSSIYQGQLAGLAIGPLVGSLVGVHHLAWVFVASGVVSLLACIPILRSSELAEHENDRSNEVEVSTGSVLQLPNGSGVNWALVGAIMTAVALGLCFGTYESCWTLLLVHRGAVAWQIGLSWTLFAVPFVVMARPGGWLADRADRRWLVVFSLFSSVFLCALYPFLSHLVWLLVLGGIEAVGLAIALPSVQSLLTQSVRPTQVGKIQGLFSTSETAAIAVAAGLGGFLFGLRVWAPFVSMATAAGLIGLSLPLVWRHVTGRVSNLPTPEPPLIQPG
jgi:MFS family permease